MSRRPSSLKPTTILEMRELYSQTPTIGIRPYRGSIARGIPPSSCRQLVHRDTLSRPHPAHRLGRSSSPNSPSSPMGEIYYVRTDARASAGVGRILRGDVGELLPGIGIVRIQLARGTGHQDGASVHSPGDPTAVGDLTELGRGAGDSEAERLRLVPRHADDVDPVGFALVAAEQRHTGAVTGDLNVDELPSGEEVGSDGVDLSVSAHGLEFAVVLGFSGPGRVEPVDAGTNELLALEDRC